MAEKPGKTKIRWTWISIGCAGVGISLALCLLVILTLERQGSRTVEATPARTAAAIIVNPTPPSLGTASPINPTLPVPSGNGDGESSVETTEGEAIAMVNLETTINEQGLLVRTGLLEVYQKVGLGTVSLAVPFTMTLDQDETVRLTIAPGAVLAELARVEVPSEAGGGEELGYELPREYGEIALYPTMLAELRGSGFDISPPGAQKKALNSERAITWEWVVTPRETGRKKLLLEIAVPTWDAAREQEIPMSLKNISADVEVIGGASRAAAPVETVAVVPDPSGNSPWLIVGAAVGLAVLVGTGGFFFYRRRLALPGEPSLPGLFEDRAAYARIRQQLVTHCSESEIQAFAFDLGFDYENLGGDNKIKKIIALLSELDRANRMTELVDLVRRQRPDVEWPDIVEG